MYQQQEAVDVNTAREIFDLSLPDLGPYAIDYTKNGRFLLLGGRKGHLALMDALRMDVQMEVRHGGAGRGEAKRSGTKLIDKKIPVMLTTGRVVLL